MEAGKTYLVPMPREEFIQMVTNKIKDYSSSVWERADPNHLGLNKVIIKNDIMYVQKIGRALGNNFQITGTIRAELKDQNGETLIVAHCVPNSGGLNVVSWLIAIISTIVFLPIIIFSPSIIAVVSYVLIQFAMITLRFIHSQESEFELQHYFSRILRELTR